MKKLLAVMAAVAFLAAVSGPVWATQPKPGAKTTVKAGKHKKSGKKEKAGKKTAETIPPAPTAIPTPAKHWWNLW